MNRLTVVMLNWKRPDNVRRFTAFYATHHRVSKVVVVNNNNSYIGLFTDTRSVDWRHKLTLINSTDDLGLPSRFAVAALARTDQVLLVDDDIDLPDDTVNRLHEEFLRNDAAAVGIFGRRPNGIGVYNQATHHGRVEVLLTRAVVTTPAVCGEACWRSVAMARELGGEPFGNGEDIVMSHVAMRHADGRRNLSVNLPYKNVSYDDEHAISVRYKEHGAHRTNVVRWCRKHLPSAGDGSKP